MSDIARCCLCGEPMPPGEEMFKFHGYSCDCPKKIKPDAELGAKATRAVEGIVKAFDGIITCSWSREEDGSDTWSTGCCKEFQINDAQSPKDSGMNFCCFCGGKLL